MEKSDGSTYSHILKYTSIFGGVQGMNILVSLVRNKFVAVILGPSGMGLAALFNNTVNLISQITNLGIGISAVRNISEQYEQGDSSALEHCIIMVRTWSFITAVFGALLCMLLGPCIDTITFSWGDHSLHYVLLAPAVAMLAITIGETAILKGVRQLRQLVVTQVWIMFASFIISVPVYYVWGESGIVPVIVGMAFASMFFILRKSVGLFRYQLSFSSAVIAEGWGMVRLGTAFMMAGVLGGAAEFLIRAYLNLHASLDTVGLYNAGFMITVTYSGMVFSAMETDYFPRLTAVNHDSISVRHLANRQIEVSLLIVSPMLAALIIFLPVIIPLMFSSKFVPVVCMTQVAVLAMYFKSIMLPIEYIPLAKGESFVHLTIETIYWLLTVAFVIIGYNLYDLVGTGWGFVASYMLNFIFVVVFVYYRYCFTMSPTVILYALVQIPLGIASYLVTYINNIFLYWGCGVLIIASSAAFSLYVLHKKTSLYQKLMSKLLRNK